MTEQFFSDIVILMARLTVGERRVYSEFFTNIAVAWFTIGIITPLFVKPKTIEEVITFAVWGISGALVSLRLAVFSSKGGKL